MVVTWTSLTTPSTGERNSSGRAARRAAQRLLVDRELGVTWLRSLSAYWRNSKLASLGLGLRLAHRGHRPALLLARGGDPALEVDHFAPGVEQVGLRERCSWRPAARASSTCCWASARLPCRLLIVAAASAASRRRCSAAAPSAAILLRQGRLPDCAQRRFLARAIRAVHATAGPCLRRSAAPTRAWSDFGLGFDLAELRGIRGLSSRASNWPLRTCWPDRTRISLTVAGSAACDHLQPCSTG